MKIKKGSENWDEYVALNKEEGIDVEALEGGK